MQYTNINDIVILAQSAVDAAPAANAATEVSAASPDAPDAPASPVGGLSSMLIWVLLFAGLWFLLFMPQRKRQKALQKLQSELKCGDSVYTTSGIVGKIVSLDEKTVTLQVSEGTRIPFLRNAVVGLVESDNNRLRQ